MTLSMKSKIHFFSNNARPRLKNIKKLCCFIELMFKKEEKPLDSINYIFCKDEALLGLNKQFLNHDYFTDIITFSFSEKGKPVIAEVYISMDRVKENAVLLKTSSKKELHRVIFHGALHLCGYGDQTKPQKRKMRTLEDYYLAKYFTNVSRDTLKG